MIIVRLTYIAPLTEVDKYLQAHREFLDYYYKHSVLKNVMEINLI